MPRKARLVSNTGIYHILLRGINRQVIFEDDEDFGVFLGVLAKYKMEFCCQIYAYCLMENHIHLLMKIPSNDLQHFMRKVGTKYVYWYNWKYDRVGGLFQDRYKSEPVENDAYFRTVFRYIHQNPVKAGICKTAAMYQQSSYKDYINPNPNQITDTSITISMLGDDLFQESHNICNEDKCLELKAVKRINDDEAKWIIRKICGCGSAPEFQALQVSARNQYLKELKRNGLSIKQIERLTGINRGLVQKA